MRTGARGRHPRRAEVCHETGAGQRHDHPRPRWRVPARWVTGDAVYGQHPGLRRVLENRGVHYVLAVPVNQRAIAKTGLIGAPRRSAHRFALWTLLADPLGRGRRQGRPPLRLGACPDQRCQ